MQRATLVLALLQCLGLAISQPTALIAQGSPLKVAWSGAHKQKVVPDGCDLAALLKDDEILKQIDKSKLPESVWIALLKDATARCLKLRLASHWFSPARSTEEVAAFFGEGTRTLGTIGGFRLSGAQTVATAELAAAAFRRVRISLATAVASAKEDSGSQSTADATTASIERLIAGGGNVSISATWPAIDFRAAQGDARLTGFLSLRSAVDLPSLGGDVSTSPRSLSLQTDVVGSLLADTSDLQLYGAAHVEGVVEAGFTREVTSANSSTSKTEAALVASIQLGLTLRRTVRIGVEWLATRNGLLKETKPLRVVFALMR